MTITIITVTYNCISTIEQTINSVIVQKNANYEFIVIDGESTDGTCGIIESYRDYIAYYISEPDAGIYDAMNKGIRKASGDYILFLNGDDYLVDDMALARISGFLDGDSIVIGKEKCGSRISSMVDMNEVESPYYGVFYPHQATFIPRKIFNSLGLYDTSYRVSADFEWICRAIFSGEKIRWVDVLVSFFRAGGISSRLECSIDEYNISKKYLEKANRYDLIPEMTSITLETVKNRIFVAMLDDADYRNSFRSYLVSFVDMNKPVQLWGGGFLAEYYVKLFNSLGIVIKDIIDKNAKEGATLNGIPLEGIDDRSNDFIFISSEVYDDEISRILLEKGEEENRDFLRHSVFRDAMIRATYCINGYVKMFEKMTGVTIL